MIDDEQHGSVTIAWRKWDGTRHWHHRAVPLGSDAHGRWFGQPRGSHSVRPGADYHAHANNVFLWPVEGDWVATFYTPDHPRHFRVYVDLAHGIRWDDANSTLTAIDMDLDVVAYSDGRGVRINDQIEFARHRIEYGYPDAVAESALVQATDLQQRILSGRAPFDGSAARWLATIDEMSRTQ